MSFLKIAVNQPEDSLPHSQNVTTWSYPMPDLFSPHLHTPTLTSISVLFFHLCPVLSMVPHQKSVKILISLTQYMSHLPNIHDLVPITLSCEENEV